MNLSIHVFFLLTIFSLTLNSHLTVSDPRKTVSGLYCGTHTVLTSSIVPLFSSAMESLQENISTSRYATTHLSNSSISLYSLAQCHADLSSTDCLLCYATCRTKLPTCLPSDAGRIYLDGCFLRYDNYSFYADSVLTSFSTVNCTGLNYSSSSSSSGVRGEEEFRESVGFAIGNVSEIAVKEGGFGVGEVGGVYALAQCWESVSTDGCRECLGNVSMEVKGCGIKKDGRGMNAGCYLRYSTNKFYDDDDKGNSKHNDFAYRIVTVYDYAPRELAYIKGLFARTTVPNFELTNGLPTKTAANFFICVFAVFPGKFSMGIIITIAFIAAAILVLSLFAAWLVYVKKKKGLENKDVAKFTSSLTRLGLNYSYETLEKATYYFSPARKLGQGGAGSVGYMAPEYLVRGQLSEKADVYSFGILALEIVWRLYKTNRLSEAVDPILDNNFPKDEATKVLQIGLLCAQATVALRPSMDQVVMMLTNKDYHTPAPSQPPFSNARLLDPEATSYRAYSTNSSSVATKSGSSYTSSETTDMNGLQLLPRS
ncbi:hypothetical protein ACFE04_009712 [Oxalis oulophora]